MANKPAYLNCQLFRATDIHRASNFPKARFPGTNQRPDNITHFDSYSQMILLHPIFQNVGEADCRASDVIHVKASAPRQARLPDKPSLFDGTLIQAPVRKRVDTFMGCRIAQVKMLLTLPTEFGHSE